MQFDFFEDDLRVIYTEEKKCKGRVRWFDKSLGYGFITADSSKGDIFFHHTSLQIPGYKNIRTGQRVIFEKCILEKAPKPVAKNIIPIYEKLSEN